MKQLLQLLSLIAILALASYPIEAGNGGVWDFELDSSQFLSRADSVPLSITGSTSVTMMAWVKFESLANGTSLAIAGKDNASGEFCSYCLGVQIVAGLTYIRPIGESSAGAFEIAKSQQTFNTDRWYHLAFTCDMKTGNAASWVNGVLAVSDNSCASTGFIDTTTDFFIGQEGGSLKFFDGRIDEIRLYDRVLTTAEINARMRSSQRFGDEVGYWRMDDLTDASVNKFHLTNNNTATQFTNDVPFNWLEIR